MELGSAGISRELRVTTVSVPLLLPLQLNVDQDDLAAGWGGAGSDAEV
jgi:hypothetical protein